MDVKKFLWWGIGAAVALAVVAVTVIVVLQNGGRERGSDGGPGGGRQESAEDAGGRDRSDIDEQEFEGSGRRTQRFQAAGGLIIFRFTHEGERNFVLQLGKGEVGNSLIVNAVGKFTGSKALGLDPGPYTLDITASGKWTLEIEQPRPTSAPSPPQELNGNGQSATSFFRLKAGTADFRMSHQGEGIFAPNLLKVNGQQITLLANEIGRFNGSKRVNVPEDGIYLVDVVATKGQWTIDVSQ